MIFNTESRVNGARVLRRQRVVVNLIINQLKLNLLFLILNHFVTSFQKSLSNVKILMVVKMQVIFHNWNDTILNFLPFPFVLLTDSSLLSATKVL